MCSVKIYRKCDEHHTLRTTVCLRQNRNGSDERYIFSSNSTQMNGTKSAKNSYVFDQTITGSTGC